MADNPEIGWRARLDEAIKASGKSRRSVSLEAGKGPGYVHSIMAEGKDPTIDSLVNVCRAANVSLSYVLYGLEISRQTEEVLSLLENNPDALAAILQILRGTSKP